MVNILVCDDEKDIVNAVAIYLSAENYNVFKAYNGREAVEIVEKEDIHLIILDIMMPVMNGIEAISRIRSISNAPVIMLSAKSEDSDKVMGLNVGADDYITKPFTPLELMARIKSQLRRYMTLGSRIEGDNIYSVGDIVLDDNTKEASVGGEPVKLTKSEYDILKLLMQNPGKVFSLKDIYNYVWKDTTPGAEGTVAVHIRHLREKIELDPAQPQYLKVVWGQGYKIGGNQ